MHCHDVGLLDQLADAREVLGHVETHFGNQRGRHRSRADFGNDQRVAVGIGGCGNGCAQNALCAAAVVDQDLLAELRAQCGLHDPRHQIGAAAGREGHDQPDRFVGISLGCRGMCRKRRGRPQAEGDDDGQACVATHVVFLVCYGCRHINIITTCHCGERL